MSCETSLATDVDLIDVKLQGVYLALTMYKFVVFVRDLGHWRRPIRIVQFGSSKETLISNIFKWKRIAPTLHLFTRDGAFYFMM